MVGVAGKPPGLLGGTAIAHEIDQTARALRTIRDSESATSLKARAFSMLRVGA